MNPILDIFNNAAFSATSLTQAINLVPNTYGRVRELGLFPGEPVATTSVTVQLVNGVLNLLPTRPRGAPATLGTSPKGKVLPFSCFHIPHDDFVRADDVQNIIARVADDQVLESVAAVVARKEQTMRNKHAITLEHLRIGALKGEILDSDGTSLLNLFTAFGVTRKEIDFVLGTAATNVGGKVEELTGYMEDNLLGETMSGVHVFASPEWFAKFTQHPKVEQAYINYQGLNNVLREDMRKRFMFKGATIEEYRGSAQYLQEDGTYGVRRFIPAGEAIAFPEGTTDTHKTYFAPADFIGTVNTYGEEIYVRAAIDPEFQRWVKLHSQSNPLPLWTRPALLVRLYSSN